MPHLEIESTFMKDQKLTLLGHSHSETLLQATVLAAVPRDLVDDAVSVPVAGVHHVFLHAAAEEALQRGGITNLCYRSVKITQADSI